MTTVATDVHSRVENLCNRIREKNSKHVEAQRAEQSAVERTYWQILIRVARGIADDSELEAIIAMGRNVADLERHLTALAEYFQFQSQSAEIDLRREEASRASREYDVAKLQLESALKVATDVKFAAQHKLGMAQDSLNRLGELEHRASSPLSEAFGSGLLNELLEPKSNGEMTDG